MKEKIIRMIHIVSACIPLLLIGLLIAHRILTGGGITAEELLTYTPESPIMAALVMILFFLCKSLSIFFPVTVLCRPAGGDHRAGAGHRGHVLDGALAGPRIGG